MRVALVLAAVLSTALAVPFYIPSGEDLLTADIGPNITYFLVEDREHPGQYVVEDLVNSEITATASGSDVTYYFYSKNNVDTGMAIKSDNVKPLETTAFSASKDTFVIIHGWQNDYKSQVNVLIRRAILSRYDVNLFVIDWSPIASQNYITAQASVTAIGEFVAGFFQTLNVVYKLDLSRVSIAGHSLGAHVSGNAGAALKGALNYIVGLDPALPGFSIGNINDRLDPTDAKFVQVIHSCGGFLGFGPPIGHSDYYPNGGTMIQPGCGIDATGSCSHSRAYQYYAESVAPSSSNLFVSRKCQSYKDFTNGKCNNNPKSNLGGYQIDRTAAGTYYLGTNDKPPFARG